MTRNSIHRYLYLLGAWTLVVSLPLSHFVMGLASFILFLNWLAEWNWKEKWENLKVNKEGLLFAGLFFVCLLGLIKTDNWSVASHNILAKVPLLFSPLIVISTKSLSKKELLCAYKFFVLSTVFCCIFSIFYWLTHTVEDIRQISVFIDHIRFSLCITLSVVFCIHILIKNNHTNHLTTYFFSAAIVLQIAYMFIAQTLTGILILAVLSVVYLFYLLVKMPKGKVRSGLITFLLLALLGTFAYAAMITGQYFKDNDKEKTALRTAMGNPYEFDEGSIIECGHRINYYVCKPELQAAWTLRSDTTYSDFLEQTLIRYLNSKGLHKDYAAVMSLSDEDVKNVEHKIANYDYTRTFGLRRALYQCFISYSIYQKNNYIEGSSFLQRIELWKASATVIKDNWFLGVGIGDYKEALDQQLEAQNSSIAHRHNRGSHNQLLTFWLMGGILLVVYFLFILIYPFIKMKDRITMLYVCLIIILFLSILTEDTLETQTGRMLFAVFVPLMLFSDKK